MQNIYFYPKLTDKLLENCGCSVTKYLLRKMKNAGFLIPIVTKGRGAKYKAGVTRGTKINIEE